MKFNRHALTLFLGFGSLTVFSVISFTGCDDSSTQGYLQTIPPMTDGNSCVLNGEYYRDGIASHCCNGGGPTSPYPTDCPPIDGTTPGVDQAMTNGIVADQVGAAAGGTASSMEGDKQNVQTGMTSGAAAALAGINGSISSGASTAPGTNGATIASALSDGAPSSNTAASAANGPGHFVSGFGAGADNGSGSGGLGGFGGGESSKTSVATDGTVKSMPAGSTVAEAAGGGSYAAGGGGAAGRYGSGSYGSGGYGSGGYGSGGLSASDFNGAAAGGNKFVGNLSERHPAGADGAGGAGSTMGTPDPADYFKRLGIGDNIFKIVEKRYALKTKQWALADANGVAQSAGVPLAAMPAMPTSAKAAVPPPKHK